MDPITIGLLGLGAWLLFKDQETGTVRRGRRTRPGGLSQTPVHRTFQMPQSQHEAPQAVVTAQPMGRYQEETKPMPKMSNGSRIAQKRYIRKLVQNHLYDPNGSMHYHKGVCNCGGKCGGSCGCGCQ